MMERGTNFFFLSGEDDGIPQWERFNSNFIPHILCWGQSDIDKAKQIAADISGLSGYEDAKVSVISFQEFQSKFKPENF
jgi:hypothetical protein